MFVGIANGVVSPVAKGNLARWRSVSTGRNTALAVDTSTSKECGQRRNEAPQNAKPQASLEHQPTVATPSIITFCILPASCDEAIAHHGPTSRPDPPPGSPVIVRNRSLK